jgi:ferredoxin--NADP+ reductase
VIGAGPAGFYAAEHILRQSDLNASVDLFDRLPTPFGLVRAGVAPDHQKIKNVTRVYDRTAARDGFRFFGNVDFGQDIDLDDLRRFYHAIIFTTGAQVDRSLGIPGEELPRSHSATEFVAWYNGHPDYREHKFDLSQERVAVVGVGNVAVDVARILCRTIDELRATDIADHALDVLAESRVKEVVLLGRRGPAQAAFTNREVKELGELEGADVLISAKDALPDPFSLAALEQAPNRTVNVKLDIIKSLSELPLRNLDKRLILRFLVSPTEIHAAEDGGVGAVTLVHNELREASGGRLRPYATDVTERLEAGLVFRSVGYRGVALPSVPFRDDWGVIRNTIGRVTNEDGSVLTGLYAAGWIKRGPSGVIGTNKACAVETVDRLLEDLEEGTLNQPLHPEPEAAAAFLASRQPALFTYGDWARLDAIEMERGAAEGRPRVKMVSVGEMLTAIES